MAELPNRPTLEADFARRFGKLARKHLLEFRRLLGDPPSLENIPPEFWLKMQREVDAETYAILLLIFDESALFHGWDSPAMGLVAFGWAKDRADSLSRYWVESVQDRLQKGFDKLEQPEPVKETTVAEARVANSFGGGGNNRSGSTATDDDDESFTPINRVFPGQPAVKVPTQDEIDELITDTFGPKRIETIAMDETTRARHAGGESAIEETVGISQDDLWRNNPQDSVTGPCKICKPLDGLKRSEWPWRYSEGPPSPHPRCVCSIDHANIPLSQAIGRMLDDEDYKSLSARKSFNVKAWFRTIPDAAEWRAYCRENEIDINDRASFKAFSPSEARDENGKWTGGSLGSKLPSPHKGEVKVVGDGDAAGLTKQIFGDGVTLSHVATMVGSPPNAQVRMSHGFNDELHVHFNTPDGEVSAHRTLFKTKNGVRCINQSLTVSKSAQGKGIGGKIVADQIEAMKNAGVLSIETTAAKGNDSIGYKVWPKLGYDANLSEADRNALPPNLKAAKTIQDLYATPLGQTWWEANGSTKLMTIELQDADSISRKKAIAYVEKIKEKSASKSTTNPADDVFSPKQHLVLDEITREFQKTNGK